MLTVPLVATAIRRTAGLPEPLAEEVTEALEDPDEERRAMLMRFGGDFQVEFDRGEAEDNTFHRDWKWVEAALNRAFNLGLSTEAPAGS